jgi:hypothetical protein
LEPRIHFAGPRDIGSFAKFFYHGQDRFGRLVEELEVFVETAPVQVGWENQDSFADLLDRLRNFIERGGEGLDVFTLERRNESFAELFGELLRDLFVLAPAVDEFVQALGRIVVLQFSQEVHQMMDATVRLLRAGFEQIKEFLIVAEEFSNRKHGMAFAPRD